MTIIEGCPSRSRSTRSTSPCSPPSPSTRGPATWRLSRLTSVARATVQSRLRRLHEAGVIADWDPTLDVAAAGYEVQAYVTLEISQGALDEVTRDLAVIPQVLEAYVTTGSYDVLCRVATRSHPESAGHPGPHRPVLLGGALDERDGAVHADRPAGAAAARERRAGAEPPGTGVPAYRS
ncbi:Lrp/AsnC ligand binding domain-containing protein [Nocardioides convexus]|uniref:Lrp/AsnC family transcriptional regulator n=1 Tax=Nocardioides convexus TaxID=2712224 RepID=UPI0024185E9E|nr:Lrp/AsnC ligand binding domain-containing protein [Nocardioides convexus]